MPQDAPPFAAKYVGLTSITCALGGALAGAIAMAFFDPASGARRRGEVVDRLRGLSARTQRNSSRQLRHLGHRLQGQLRRGRSCVCGNAATSQPDPERLKARVRTALGRLCEDATTVEVRVLHDGVIELHGEVARMEHRRVVQGVRRVAGVSEVRSFLQIHGAPRAEDGEAAVMH